MPVRAVAEGTPSSLRGVPCCGLTSAPATQRLRSTYYATSTSGLAANAFSVLCVNPLSPPPPSSPPLSPPPPPSPPGFMLLSGALGICGTSSQFDNTYSGANAVDGDLSTEWATASVGTGSWICITLPGSYAVAQLTFWQRQTTSSIFDLIVDALATFSDGTTQTFRFSPYSVTTARMPVTLSVTGTPTWVNVSVLSVQGTGTAASQGNVGLAEVYAYGFAYPPPSPPSSPPPPPVYINGCSGWASTYDGYSVPGISAAVGGFTLCQGAWAPTQAPCATITLSGGGYTGTVEVWNPGKTLSNVPKTYVNSVSGWLLWFDYSGAKQWMITLPGDACVQQYCGTANATKVCWGSASLLNSQFQPPCTLNSSLTPVMAPNYAGQFWSPPGAAGDYNLVLSYSYNPPSPPPPSPPPSPPPPPDDGTGCTLSTRYLAAVQADAPQHWWRLLDRLGASAATDCGAAGVAGAYSTGLQNSLRQLGQTSSNLDIAVPYSAYFAGGINAQYAYVCGSPNGVVTTPANMFAEFYPTPLASGGALGSAAYSMEYWYQFPTYSLLDACAYPIFRASSGATQNIILSVLGGNNTWQPQLQLGFAANSCTLQPNSGAGMSLTGFNHIVVTVAAADSATGTEQLMSAYVNGNGPWSLWCNSTGGPMTSAWDANAVRAGSPADPFTTSWLSVRDGWRGRMRARYASA